MHCPQCGNRQNSTETHFCTKCGFEISDVREMLKIEVNEVKKRRKSAYNKALRQGLAMMLCGLVLIAIFSVLRDYLAAAKSLMTISALLFCIGGAVRMCLPYIFGADKFSGSPDKLPEFTLETNKLPKTQFSKKTLAEAEYREPINGQAVNYETRELAPVSSVTEVTTKDLDQKFQS